MLLLGEDSVGFGVCVIDIELRHDRKLLYFPEIEESFTQCIFA